jgi:hypothetical protein
LTSFHDFRQLNGSSLMFAFNGSHLMPSGTFSATLTTKASDPSRLRWFATRSCKPVARGHVSTCCRSLSHLLRRLLWHTLVNAPRGADGLGESAPPLLELWDIPRHTERPNEESSNVRPRCHVPPSSTPDPDTTADRRYTSAHRAQSHRRRTPAGDTSRLGRSASSFGTPPRTAHLTQCPWMHQNQHRYLLEQLDKNQADDPLSTPPRIGVSFRKSCSDHGNPPLSCQRPATTFLRP